MSMSQEEIEALMSGLDIDENDSEEVEEHEVPSETEENDTMSEDDIAELIAKTDMPATDASEEIVAVDELEPIADDIKEDRIVEEVDIEPAQEDIDSMFEGIGDISEELPEEISKEIEEEVEEIPEKVTKNVVKENTDMENEVIAKTWTDNKINEGIFPLPVEREHKVVNQLSQVANDSEEKASKIFDVLSFILDENNVVQNHSKNLDAFLAKQIVLLDTLSKKFPNVESFQANLEMAQSLKDVPTDISNRLNAENMQLFQAMELMQFNDINRQKIERVMTVIKKLSTYLNNLFEDETGYHDVSNAKHIHGDENNELVDEADLDALIAQFANN